MPLAAHFIIPGSLEQRTGGYLYDARIIEGLLDRGWLIAAHELPASNWPLLRRDRAQDCAELLDTLPDEALIVIDGLAIAGLLPMLPDLARRCRIAALIHCPLHRETGLSPALRERLYREEREALGFVDRIITTSPWAAGDVTRAFGIGHGHIGVVQPGVDPAPLAAGSGGGRLLSVASLSPRKDQLTLLEALAPLRHLDWELHLVGSPERDPGYAARVRAAIRELDLSQRVVQTGELSGEALSREYHEADIFVLPSRYETYGMVLTEALARGLPIVCTTAGASPATVPAGARLSVPPGDPAALGEAVAELLSDGELRRDLAGAAARARERLQRWGASVQGFARELVRLQRGR